MSVCIKCMFINKECYKQKFIKLNVSPCNCKTLHTDHHVNTVWTIKRRNRHHTCLLFFIFCNIVLKFTLQLKDKDISKESLTHSLTQTRAHYTSSRIQIASVPQNIFHKNIQYENIISKALYKRLAIQYIHYIVYQTPSKINASQSHYYIVGVRNHTDPIQ